MFPDHPYHILFITEHFPPQVGGVANSARRLVEGIAARGAVVHVLHLGADVEMGTVQSVPLGKIMVHRLGALDTPDLTLQLAEQVIAHLQAHVGFHLLHGHFLTPAGYLAAYTARRFGAKSFVSVRGNDLDRGAFRSDQLPFIQWTLQHADGIGCVSRELVEKCRALADRAAHYTPNAVDATLFRPQSKDDELLRDLNAQGATILGFVGELRFKKGTHFILDAFRAVHEQRPAKLLLVGGLRGEDKTLLRRFLRQHPALRDDVQVVEYQQDRETLVRYYNLMDIVLSPSLWDGMPNSVLEAMACGRVVLASDVGGIRDVITHGDSGVLLGVHDLHRLGDACLEILAAGAEVSASLGQRAREVVLADYTPDKEISRLLDRYAGVLGQTSA